MIPPRRPSAFQVEPQPTPPGTSGSEEAIRRRRPRSIDAEIAIADELDAFEAADPALSVPPPPIASRRRSWLSRLFFGSVGALVTLALGLWIEQFVRELFARTEWLGWLAAVLAGVAAAALSVILIREIWALSRLASVEKLRARAIDAVATEDAKKAREVADDLAAFVAGRPDTAAGRRALEELKGDIIDGAGRIRIAEREILAPLDARARVMILDAAKRVSVVTAISPRALVDIAYVAFEAGRLIRRLSVLYGGRPGTLGFIRVARNVLAHLAVTGAIAAGDDFVHQIVGQGLAARLSARLGEGVVNGMMTARIGLAAMETTRPLPFVALKRPGMSDFLAALSSFTRQGKGIGSDE
jgi:putative membrane protein